MSSLQSRLINEDMTSFDRYCSFCFFFLINVKLKNVGSPFSKISLSTPLLINSSRLCRIDIFLSRAEDRGAQEGSIKRHLHAGRTFERQTGTERDPRSLCGEVSLMIMESNGSLWGTWPLRPPPTHTHCSFLSSSVFLLRTSENRHYSISSTWIDQNWPPPPPFCPWHSAPNTFVPTEDATETHGLIYFKHRLLRCSSKQRSLKQE